MVSSVEAASLTKRKALAVPETIRCVSSTCTHERACVRKDLQYGMLSNRLDRILIITSFIFAGIQCACKANIDGCPRLLKPAN